MEGEQKDDVDPYDQILAEFSNMQSVQTESQRLEMLRQEQEEVYLQPASSPFGPSAAAHQVVHHQHHHNHGQTPPGDLHRLGLRNRQPGARRIHFHFRRQVGDDGDGGTNRPRVPHLNIPSVNFSNPLRRSGAEDGTVHSPQGQRGLGAKQWVRERRDAVRQRTEAVKQRLPGRHQSKASEDKEVEEARDGWRRGFLKPSSKGGQRVDDEFKDGERAGGMDAGDHDLSAAAAPKQEFGSFTGLKKGFLNSASTKFPKPLRHRRHDRARAKSSEDVLADVEDGGIMSDDAVERRPRRKRVPGLGRRPRRFGSSGPGGGGGGEGSDGGEREGSGPSHLNPAQRARELGSRVLGHRRRSSRDVLPGKQPLDASADGGGGWETGDEAGGEEKTFLHGLGDSKAERISKKFSFKTGSSRPAETSGDGGHRRSSTSGADSHNEVPRPGAKESTFSSPQLPPRPPVSTPGSARPSAAETEQLVASPRESNVLPSAQERLSAATSSSLPAQPTHESNILPSAQQGVPAAKSDSPPPQAFKAGSASSLSPPNSTKKGVAAMAKAVVKEEQQLLDDDDDRWHCPICLAWLTAPVAPPCGHTCCAGCLQKVVRQAVFPAPRRPGERPPSAQDPACPLCRAKFKPADVRPERALYAQMLRARVQCPQAGCGARFSPLHARAHEGGCPMLETNCPHAPYGCEWCGLRRDLAGPPPPPPAAAAAAAAGGGHLAVCPYEQVKGLFPRVYGQLRQLRGAAAQLDRRLGQQQRALAAHAALLREAFAKSHWRPAHHLQLVGAVFWDGNKWAAQRDRWRFFSFHAALTLLYHAPLALTAAAVWARRWGASAFDDEMRLVGLEELRGAGARGPLLPVTPLGSGGRLCWAVNPGFALYVVGTYVLLLVVEGWEPGRWVLAVRAPARVKASWLGPLVPDAWELSRHALVALAAWVFFAALALGCGGGGGGALAAMWALALVLPMGLEGPARAAAPAPGLLKARAVVWDGLAWGYALGAGGAAAAGPPTWARGAQAAALDGLCAHAAAALAGPRALRALRGLGGLDADLGPTVRLAAGAPDRSLRTAAGWALVGAAALLLAVGGKGGGGGGAGALAAVVARRTAARAALLVQQWGVGALARRATAPPPGGPRPRTPPPRGWADPFEWPPEFQAAVALRGLLGLAAAAYAGLAAEVLLRG